MTISNIKMRLPALLLYIAALSLAAMYTVNLKNYIPCAFIMAAVASALMLTLSFCRRRVAGYAIMALGVGSMVSAVLVFNFMGDDNADFLEYIFSGSSRGFNWTWALASAVIFGILVGYICFYFAIHTNAASWIIAAVFVVAVLASRTMGTLPLWLIVLITGSYVLVLGCSNICLDEYKLQKSAVFARYTCAAVITVLAVAVAALIPKAASMSGKELVNKILLGTGGYNYNISTFQSQSSVNVGENSRNNEELFRVRAHAPVNLIYGGFDDYKGEQGWTTLDYYNKGYPDWRSSGANIGYIINRLREAAGDGALRTYADRLKNIPAADESRYVMEVVHSPNSVSLVLMHPISTYNASITNEEARYMNVGIFATERNELFSSEEFVGLQYELNYYGGGINPQFARAFTSEELEELLKVASAEGILSQDMVNAFLDEMQDAEYYHELTAYRGVSQQIKELADEITEGAETDYDKMMRIIRWFEREDFVYDLDYVPRESTAEYFLFESKRGICSDFATATALLCRGAGLTAIYTEGFAMDENNRAEDGMYIITDANAHAFVQVYINGYGWYCLDTTGYAEEAVRFELPQELVTAILIGVIALAAVALAAYLLRRQLADAWFALSYRAAAPERAVRGILVRIRREAGKIAKLPADTMTAQDTARIIYGLGLTAEAQRFMSACDRVSYGAGGTNKTEPPILYEDYKTLKAARRRRK